MRFKWVPGWGPRNSWCSSVAMQLRGHSGGEGCRSVVVVVPGLPSKPPAAGMQPLLRSHMVGLCS